MKGLLTTIFISFVVCSVGFTYTPPKVQCESDNVAIKPYHSPLSHQFHTRNPTDFVLIRILSNDLFPRHIIGQTLNNLRFMLDHEVPLPICTNLWIVNRIFNKTQEQEVINLLNDYKQIYQVIPFQLEDWLARYVKQGFLSSSSYATEVNVARNIGIEEGKKMGNRYILVWDGNEYITLEDWNSITEGVYQNPSCMHLHVPIVRVPGTNEKYLLQNNNHKWERFGEPQLIFRNDSTLTYDLKHGYGLESKNYLVLKLKKQEPECAQRIGKVYRLYSGRGKAGEQDSRGIEREAATAVFHGWLYERAVKCLGFTETNTVRNRRLGGVYRRYRRRAQSLRFDGLVDLWTDETPTTI